MSQIFLFCEPSLNDSELLESIGARETSDQSDPHIDRVQQAKENDSIYFDEIHNVGENENVWSAKFVFQVPVDASFDTKITDFAKLWVDVKSLKNRVQVFKLYFESHNETVNGLVVLQKGECLKTLRTEFNRFQWMLDSTTDWKYANSITSLNYAFDSDDIKSDTLTSTNLLELLYGSVIR
jgi:hypothetical protein